MTHVEEIVLRLRDQYSKGMKSAETATKRNRKAVGQLDGQVNKLRKTALRAFGAFSAGYLIKQVSQAGIEMEQTRVSFTTFLGDAQKANKIIGDLNQFSNVTPFTNKEIIQGGKSLLAFGIAEDQVLTKLRAIGDVSAGTGKNFNELTTIYGKAQVAGTLYAEDINQLVEAGIPIIDQFAKQLGVAPAHVKKLASEGKIGFNQLDLAFQNMTGEGGLFFNLMEKQSKTVGGRISTLRGQLQTVSIAIGEALLPTIGAITDKVGQFTAWISANKDTIAAWVPIVVKIITTIGILIAAVKAYTIVQGILNVVMTANPIGVIIMLIGALIGIIVIWRDRIKEAISSNTLLGKILRIVFAPVILLYKGIKWLVDAVKEWLKTSETGQKITQAWRVVMMGFGLAIKKVGDWFRDLPNKAISAFTVIKQKVMGFVNTVRGAVKFLMNPFDEKERNKGLAQMNKGVLDMSESAGDIYRKTYNERKERQAAEEAKAEAEANRKLAEEAKAAEAQGQTGLGSLSNSLDAGKNGIGGGLDKTTGSVSGSTPKSITINIDKLVEGLSINTTNLKEGSAEIREMITRALLTAVNDTQAAIQ